MRRIFAVEAKIMGKLQLKPDCIRTGFFGILYNSAPKDGADAAENREH
jgi:hypothetical protein